MSILEKNKLQKLSLIYNMLDIDYFLYTSNQSQQNDNTASADMQGKTMEESSISNEFSNQDYNKNIDKENIALDKDINAFLDSVDIKKSNDLTEVKIKPAKSNLAKLLPKIDYINKIDLSHIKNLDELREYLLKFEECELKKTAINTVFGEGSHSAKILIIGEAPGEQEDETGRPFVGRSGMLLNQALEDIGITRENSFVTNSIFWRPPGNRNPTDRELAMCYPFLQKIIELINPKIVILVGSKAAQNILQQDTPISQLRNIWHNLDNPIKTTAKVVFHPAYLLRNPTQKKFLWYDMLAIKEKCNELSIL